MVLNVIFIFYIYIYRLIFLDILHLKSESWNELEEQEELLNNVPDQKISQIEKADLLRYYHML